LGASALLGGLIGGAVFTWYQGQIATQQERNQFLQSEISKLDAEIKDIATLQQQITSLRARQAAVENLQANRNLPVHLLEELVVQIPDGVFLNTMRQEGGNVLLTGVAQSQERVSELLRNLGTKSQWLSRPELVEIVASSSSVAGQPRRVANFTVRVSVKRPVTEAAPAGKV